MYKDLSHLSLKEIESLMKEYYGGKSVKKILANYNLSISPSTLYKFFPPIQSNMYRCEHCNIPLVASRKSKNNNIYFEKDFFCPICNHLPFDNNCNCENCQAKDRKIQMIKRKKIYDTYSQNMTPINFENITFENKVFLGALCNLQLSEDMKVLIPYDKGHINVPLSPSDNLTYDIYRMLSYRNIITVNPESPIEAFKDSEDFPNTYYINKVIYNINITSENEKDKKQLFSTILNPNYYNDNLSVEAYNLWLKIAVEECCEYLVYQLNKANFDFSPGEKTYKTFELILETFSVSQIYGIIWRSVANIAKLYLEKNISRQHAANAVIGACQRYAERAKLDKWKLSEYSRIKELPQSELSSFFFNRVLKIGELGFNMAPSII